MNYVISIGLIAAFLSTVSLLPQVLKSWKTKSTKDISFQTIFIIVSATLLWLIYGILRKDIPIIITNSIGLLTGGFILVLKTRYG